MRDGRLSFLRLTRRLGVPVDRQRIEVNGPQQGCPIIIVNVAGKRHPLLAINQPVNYAEWTLCCK